MYAGTIFVVKLHTSKIDNPPHHELIALLHEYDRFAGKHVNCWLISGLMAQMAQPLQINLKRDLNILCRTPQATRLSVPERESRRRLIWGLLPNRHALWIEGKAL
jgi:hypothetical protein